MAMKVSLCGPHSLDTSTFPPTAIELVVNGAASPPLSRMNSYLLHQVGSCELFCASTFTREFFVNRLSPSKAKTDANTSRFFAMNFLPLIEISVRHSLRCSGCADSIATVETTEGDSESNITPTARTVPPAHTHARKTSGQSAA